MSIEVCVTAVDRTGFTAKIEMIIKGKINNEEGSDKKINACIKENTIYNINLKCANKYKTAYNEGVKNMTDKKSKDDFINALYKIKKLCGKDGVEYGFIEKKYKDKFTLAKGRQSYGRHNASIYLNKLCYAEDNVLYYVAHSHPSERALSSSSPGDIELTQQQNMREKKSFYVITNEGEVYFTTPELANDTIKKYYELDYIKIQIYGQVYLGKIEENKNGNRLTVTYINGTKINGTKEYITEKSEDMIFHNYNRPVRAFLDCQSNELYAVLNNCENPIIKQYCRNCPKASIYCYYDKCRSDLIFKSVENTCIECQETSHTPLCSVPCNKSFSRACITCIYEYGG